MKKTIVCLAVPFVMYAQSLSQLFDALKAHSQTKSDEMAVQKSEVQQDLVSANLYPKVNLFGSYDNYSSPTNMKPISPLAIQGMFANVNTPQPYSYNIYRAGVDFSVPIFVKSLYTAADKAKAIVEDNQKRTFKTI
jgi:outer membrane protein TolC